MTRRLCRESLPGLPGFVFEFRAIGRPAPQGSKRVLIHRSTGRPVAIESSRHVKAWRTAVAQQARAAWERQEEPPGPRRWPPACDRAVLLRVLFFLPRPLKAKPWGWAATGPDWDKLVRATGDALVDAGVLRDDRRVVAVVGAKVWADGWTGARIALFEVGALGLDLEGLLDLGGAFLHRLDGAVPGLGLPGAIRTQAEATPG